MSPFENDHQRQIQKVRQRIFGTLLFSMSLAFIPDALGNIFQIDVFKHNAFNIGLLHLIPGGESLPSGVQMGIGIVEGLIGGACFYTGGKNIIDSLRNNHH